MKTLAKFVLASTLALATASGTATVIPSPAAAAEQPWANVGYLVNGQLVGGAQHYCDGTEVSWGNTTTFDTAVWTYYYMCP